MFLNKIKFLNKNNSCVRQLVGLRSFPGLYESINSYEKLYRFRIFESFRSTVARNRFYFDQIITGETFKAIVRNKYSRALNIDYLMNDLSSKIRKILLYLWKYLDNKSLQIMVKYLYLTVKIII